MKRSRFVLNAFRLLLAFVFLAGCSGQPTPTTAPMPTSTPEPTPAPSPTPNSAISMLKQAGPLPPLVLPAGGSGMIAKDGAVEVSFSEPMETGSTTSAFQFVDASGSVVAGKVDWPAPDRLRFQPEKALEPGALYKAVIGEGAKDSRGVALKEDVTLTFQVNGAIRVNQVFPADGTQDVENTSAITVLFDRPVVPLRIAEEQDRLPNPLVIDPPVEGKGEWVNTSVFVLKPTDRLKGSTTYRVTVPAGLEDATGSGSAPLAEDYSFTFTTMPPSVLDLAILPGGDEAQKSWATSAEEFLNAPLNPVFQLEFLQPMDHASTEAAVRLIPVDPNEGTTGDPVPFEASWNEESTQLTVKPAARLALDSHYRVVVSQGAAAADGGVFQNDVAWFLSTVRSPAIEYTNPADGEQTANYWAFEVGFASPMNIKSVTSRVTFDPPLSQTSGNADNWYYDPYRFVFYFYGLAAGTSYTATLAPGMEDIYGNAITEGRVVRFTTGALQPSAWFAMPDKPLWRAGTRGDFYMHMANVREATISLYRLAKDDVAWIESTTEYGRINAFDPGEDSLVWQQTIQPDLPPDKNRLVKVTVSPDADIQTGFYLLGLDVPGLDKYGRRFNDLRMVMVSNNSLTLKVAQKDALAWLTNLETGAPVAGQRVELYDLEGFKLLGSGVTGADGLVSLDILKSSGLGYAALAAETGAPDFAYANSGWGSGVWPGDFGIGYTYYGGYQPYVSYVYTERPIYRPGQTVYFKGILRQDDDLQYSLPDQKTIEVSISSYEQEVFTTTLDVSDFGTFNGSFVLDSDAALGAYYLKVFFKGEADYPIAGLNFTVAEYRRPEFRVNIEAAPADVLIGDSFSANLKAEYYSGGGVANAAVAWTLRSAPFSFTPPEKFSRYRFNDYDRDLFEMNFDQGTGEADNLVAQGTAQTDENGQLTLTIPVDLEKDASQQLVFEAAVTDLSGSMVAGRTEVVAHRSQVYPGLRFADYVGEIGKDTRLDLIALDWDGNPVAGQKVTVEIVERRWHSVQEQSPTGTVSWTSSVEEIPVETFADVQLDSGGKGSVSFKAPNGGVFRARVTAADGKGNLGSASDYLWVAGPEYIPWRQGNERSFQLITDRENYKPGDTAQILIASPFQGQNYALVTVERGRIRKQEVLLLETNSQIYNLPITPDFAPNAYISVIVIKGVDETNPMPDYRVGMTEIKVSTEQQALTVAVTPDRESAGPGESVTYTVKVTDPSGSPVEAEVSMGLSDLATLSLSAPNSVPILDGFYNRRGLNVTTSISIINSLEASNASLKDYAEEPGMGRGSGGGKGEGEMGVFEIRQDFPDTAFWRPDVRTDASGQAQVAVRLPDNLTIWRMDARAVTTDTRVGDVIQDLRSTKPLLVRPQTPRFFVEGDRLSVGTAVHNNSDQNLSVDVTLEVENLELASEGVQTVKIDAGKQAYVTWQVSVPSGADVAQLTFSAKGGPFMDASRPTIGTAGIDGLPIYRYEAQETVATSGQMTEGGARAEAILLPQSWDVSQGQLTVSVAPSLSASLTEGLNYLKHYPYECTEQTISRFLPNVAIARVLREANAADPELEAGLDEQVNLALQRLASWQNPDGGWGYWKPSDSDSLVTAYALLGLIEAKEAGYDVPANLIEDALFYLKFHIESAATRWEQSSRENRAAFVLYVLARGGDFETADINRLYDRRINLHLYARAYLAQAIWLADPADPRLATLRSDLNNAAVLSASGTHWNEASDDRWNWNTDTRTTAIVLDALVKMDAKNPINANAVRWLMAHRTGGRWEGTQETAWSLLALADWMRASGELKANYEFAVALNGETVGQGTANADTLKQVTSTQVEVAKLLKDSANSLVFARTAGEGNLYYTADLKVWLPVSEVKALDRGITISRTYTRASAPEEPVSSAELGELLRVRIAITAPAGLHYVLIEDPFPAGFEAVDTSLLTSPQGEKPQEYSWRDYDKTGWGWWYFNHSELRDEKLVLSATYLPAGTYVYTYLVRASTRGTFNVIPPTAQEFYFPEVYGRGDGMTFEVK